MFFLGETTQYSSLQAIFVAYLLWLFQQNSQVDETTPLGSDSQPCSALWDAEENAGMSVVCVMYFGTKSCINLLNTYCYIIHK